MALVIFSEEIAGIPMETRCSNLQTGIDGAIHLNRKDQEFSIVQSQDGLRLSA